MRGGWEKNDKEENKYTKQKNKKREQRRENTPKTISEDFLNTHTYFLTQNNRKKCMYSKGQICMKI
jgi:CRISPR/Cas system CSM-associated protein Csm5 (group 7 of RAMP superfamily)